MQDETVYVWIEGLKSENDAYRSALCDAFHKAAATFDPVHVFEAVSENGTINFGVIFSGGKEAAEFTAWYRKGAGGQVRITIRPTVH
jgi:hypothetical protein